MGEDEAFIIWDAKRGRWVYLLWSLSVRGVLSDGESRRYGNAGCQRGCGGKGGAGAGGIGWRIWEGGLGRGEEEKGEG